MMAAYAYSVMGTCAVGFPCRTQCSKCLFVYFLFVGDYKSPRAVHPCSSHLLPSLRLHNPSTMKFARVLRTTAEDLPNLPELQALFSAYKQLKKQIKKMPYKDAVQHRDSGPGMAELAGSQAGPPACVAEAAGGAASPALAQPSAAVESCEQGEVEFIESLGRALAQMNDLFLEKEEECVIRVEQLEGALAAAGGDVVQLGSIHKQLVDFHGEVLLLVHFAILAYTATVKILKKHHKRTGLLLRAPLGNLLSQPFCSTEVRMLAARLAALAGYLCRGWWLSWP